MFLEGISTLNIFFNYLILILIIKRYDGKKNHNALHIFNL